MMSLSEMLRFFSDPLFMFSLGVTLTLILMGFGYFLYYSMASSSNSSAPEKEKEKSSGPKVTVSTQDSFKYDVFISFFGRDTRENFVDHLYQALTQKGIYTYKDDGKIQKGERISDELIKAVEDSRFYIIVFSKNYASSSWCLDELVKIMECHNKTGHTAWPVFCDVEPSQVRKQSGDFGEAFSKHEKGGTATKWKQALKEAANLAGWELKNTLDGHEGKLIKKIVQEISLELPSVNFGFVEKLVGMEIRVRDVISSLEIGTDEVRMIGIKGMGGAGKTTLARAVFDHISVQFECQSFVENVKEVSNSAMLGLKKLQEQVLSAVLNEHVTVSSVTHGQIMMKERMHDKKVLLVLDDVDSIEQLKALAAEPMWFKPGSRIIITTRDEQVLVAHRVHLIHDVHLLSHKEAICLFSRFAFGRENPLQGYEELSEKVVRYAAGLPLTVTVLGSFLCGKDMVEWVDAIDRLERVPLKATLENLELSYISLEDDYKETFLDIACILKGEHREYAIRVLESCGFHARIVLKVLEQRSLITVDESEFLRMHDHIQAMGKNIVRRSHPDEPDKHSHLWIDEEIEDILVNGMGTGATRCLKLNTRKENLRLLMKGLGKMKKLRYLDVEFELRYSDSSQLDEFTQYFPNSLNYLKFKNYPFMYLPKTFQANNLVGLEIRESRMVQLWEEGEEKVLNKLKFLSLSQSDLTTFDFRITPNLETLSLENSFDLVKLFMPICCQKLKHLNISGSKLRTFDLESTPNLETLSLENCAHFEELNSICMLKHLKSLTVDHCDLLEKLPKDLGRLECLEKLKVSSKKIKDLPDSICMLKRLKHLKLDHCALLEKLPEDLGLLQCLEQLTLTDTGISHLPQSIFRLKGLLITASSELLELYAFPSQVKTTSGTKQESSVMCFKVGTETK